MGDLILHIGSHKTGTTSIQKALRTALKQTDRSDPVFINVRQNGRMTNTADEGPAFRGILRAKHAENVLTPQKATAIASDEGMFWLNDPADIGTLRDIVVPRFGTVKILCYLRRQDLLASSHRRQVIGNKPASRFYGVNDTPLPLYQPHFQSYFDYAAKLQLWADAFGKENVTVVPFETTSLRDGDVVADFAHRTGAKFASAEWKNTSFDGNATYLGLKLSGLGLKDARIDRILDRVEGTSPFLPTKDEARAFLAHFADANERLARDWGLEFDMSFERYPESADHRWSNADVDAMLNALLAELKKNKNPS